MNHDLKIEPQYYARVKDGSKTYEVRYNDRHFQKGDTVTLREWDDSPANSTDISLKKGYTDAPPLQFEVGFVYSLSNGHVVFSLLPIKKGATKNAVQVSS